VAKSRRLRRLKHVAGMGVRRGADKVLLGRPDKRDHVEEMAIDGRIM
jgi:hypothetical protein